MRHRMLLAMASSMVTLTACGSESSVQPRVLVLRPQALVSCAQPPEPGSLQARLWISGSDAPCFLTVDEASSSGACDVVPGVKRVFTLDWFVDRGGRDVVLAQASRTVDLTGATEATVDLTFVDDDYSSDGCLDMAVDSLAGSPTVDVNGIERPVCDLDDDGDSNVVEVCRGDDPLGLR